MAVVGTEELMAESCLNAENVKNSVQEADI